MTTISTHFPQPIKLSAAILGCLLCLILSACTAVPGVHKQPTDTLDALRTAVREDSRMDFLGTLSLPTLREFEHAVLVGWPEVRSAWGFLANDARLLSVEPVQPITRPDAASNPGDPWVWPDPDTLAVRATLAFQVDGRELVEDLLIVREEVRSEGSSSDRHIRVGDRYILRDRHPNQRRLPPQATEPVYSWRLLVPYQPFQQDGALVRLLAAGS